MRKIFLGALILFLTMSASEKVLAWEGGSTGWCTDENGRNFRCDEGGSSYSPPSTSESPVYMPPDNTPPVYTPPPETEEHRRARELNKECNEKYWDKEDYANAVSCYEKVLSIFPSESVVENNLRRARQAKINVEGKQYYHDHNWEMAVNSFKEALTYGPNSDIEYNLRLAEDSLKKEGQRKKAIALNDNECIQYRLCGDFDKAISCYEKAVSLYPSDTVIQNNLKLAKQDKANTTGLAYFNEGNWQTAITYFKEALTYGPDSNVKINLVRAEAMLKLEEQEKAEQRHGSNLAEAKKRIKNMLDNLVIDFDGATTGSAAGSSSALSFIDPSQAGGQGPAVVVAGKPPSDGRVVTPTTDSQNVDYLKQRTNFESEYWDLEDKISKEKDPIKRMEMINRQTYIKSQIGVLEIEILDKYKEEQKKEKDVKMKALLTTSALATLVSDFDSSLKNLNEALQQRPGDEGIKQAINYVTYIKDMKTGKIQMNLKYPVLVDAIYYGKGDWKTSIAYLKLVSEAYPEDMALSDAVNVIKGINSYELDYKRLQEKPEEEKNRDAADRYLKATDLLAKHDYQGALSILQKAYVRYPDNPAIRDATEFVSGLVIEQKRPSQAINKARPMTFREYNDSDALCQRALNRLFANDYEGAMPFLIRAYEIVPDQSKPEIRELINYVEGWTAERRYREGKLIHKESQ